MRNFLLSIFLFFSPLAFGECDFEEILPESWVKMLPDDQVQEHFDLTNYALCKMINKHFASIGKPESDCNIKPLRVPPILKLKQPGDLIAYFTSPEECYKDSTQPLYSGYALYRNGKQVEFDLHIGTHNKALKARTQ